MIQLKISGRAGNQLFQYMAPYSYMKENNIDEKLKISFEYLKERKTDDNSFVDILKYFKVEEYEIIDKVEMSFKQKLWDKVYRIFYSFFRSYRKFVKKPMTYNDWNIIEKLLHKRLNKNGLYYYMPTNLEFYPSNTKNIIFDGVYETKEFFDLYKNEVKEMFAPIEKPKKENFELYQTIEKTNSVCITIRRGDFLMNAFKRNFYICTPEYFYKAIEKMNSLVDSPQYIVFSDDVEWCKNNMNFPNGTLFESGNDEIWEKIRLMYSCKHFIISNSTFSWWAQYLGRNDEKKVIAPKEWNRLGYSAPIYDSEWILL